MQYSEYHESYEGHYDWHTDTSPDVDNMYQRKLSMSIQLDNGTGNNPAAEKKAQIENK